MYTVPTARKIASSGTQKSSLSWPKDLNPILRILNDPTYKRRRANKSMSRKIALREMVPKNRAG